MSAIDWAALAVGAMVWLLFRPQTLPIRWPTQASTSELSEIEWLVALSAQLVTSSNLSQAMSKCGPTPIALTAQIEVLSRGVQEFGIRALGAVDWLTMAARDHRTVERRWDEQSAAARSSSAILANFPVAIWVLSGFSGGEVVKWLFGSPFGWLCLTCFTLLTIGSRTLLRRLSQIALTSKRQVRTTKEMSSSVLSFTVLVAAWFFLPSAAGIALGASFAAAIKYWWPSLQSDSTIEFQRQVKTERAWVAALLSAALAAGLDWQRALDWASSGAEVSAQELREVGARLSFGVSPQVAFSGASEPWLPIAVALEQCAISGSPVSSGLFELARFWLQEARDENLERVTRIASRAVLPVSLLQLPAFLVGGLVPILAVSLLPLFEGWLSTSN